MNVIWEVFQKIEKQNINLEQLEVIPAKVSSPYYEVSLDMLNENISEQRQRVEVNPLYRYPQVFEQYLHMEVIEKEEEEERNAVFNQIFHYFYEIEKYRQYKKEDIYVELLTGNLEEGCFGRQVKEAFEQLDKEEKTRVIKVLLRVYQLGISFETLREAAKVLFPKCYAYLDKKYKTVLLYTGMGMNGISLAKVELLNQLFMPIGLELEVFWKYHFGIVDVEETMVLDQMELD